MQGQQAHRPAQYGHHSAPRSSTAPIANLSSSGQEPSPLARRNAAIRLARYANISRDRLQAASGLKTRFSLSVHLQRMKHALFPAWRCIAIKVLAVL